MYKIIFIIVFLYTCIQTQAQNKSNPSDTAAQIGVAGSAIETDDIPYTFVEVAPKFQGGGDEVFILYVQKNVVYPKDAKELKIMGTVYVEFIIEKDGSVSNVKIVPGRGVYASIDQAVINTVKDSPKWEPGINKNKAVRFKKVARIRFDETRF